MSEENELGKADQKAALGKKVSEKKTDQDGVYIFDNAVKCSKNYEVKVLREKEKELKTFKRNVRKFLYKPKLVLPPYKTKLLVQKHPS